MLITSTRSTRTIQNIPTRIEFIGSEELDEKGNMKAGDIRMLLVRVQYSRTKPHRPQVPMQVFVFRGLTDDIRKS